MKAESRRRILLLTVWAGLATAPALPVASADKGARERPELQLSRIEVEICRTNLDVIFQAIQAYRRANKTLPDQLSDLVPQYLADPAVLNCPTSRRVGRTSQQSAAYKPGEITDQSTTYLYEFRTNAIPKSIDGGSRRSMREWKQLQMGLAGSEVPIVRCFLHRESGGPCLNLSFGGRIYDSGVDWEKNYSQLVNPKDLSFLRLFAKAEDSRWRVVSIPPRDPQTPPGLVDLSDFYNASLTKCWSGPEPCEALTNLAPGVRTLDGVQFDVRGVIQLYADADGLDGFPLAVTHIPVRLQAQRLHFLHATIQPVRVQTKLGDYLVGYENAQSQSIPIYYGRQVRDWRIEKRDAVLSADTRVGWTSAAPSPASSGRPFVLYHTQWNNPMPEALIQSLAFRSAGTGSGPFLVAVTVEP